MKTVIASLIILCLLWACSMSPVDDGDDEPTDKSGLVFENDLMRVSMNTSRITITDKPVEVSFDITLKDPDLTLLSFDLSSPSEYQDKTSLHFTNDTYYVPQFALTLDDGVYRGTGKILTFYEPGLWYIDNIRVKNTQDEHHMYVAAKNGFYLRNDSYSDTKQTSCNVLTVLTIVNDNAPVLPPILEDVSADRATVTDGDRFTLGFKVNTDNDINNIRYIITPPGPYGVQLEGNIQVPVNDEGLFTDKKTVIPQYESGVWTVDRIEIFGSGFTIRYYVMSSESETYYVYNNNDEYVISDVEIVTVDFDTTSPDTTLPVITNVDFEKTTLPTGTGILVRVDVSDDNDVEVSVTVDSESSGIGFYLYNMGDGTYEGVIRPNELPMEGEIMLKFISVNDIVGRRISLYPDDYYPGYYMQNYAFTTTQTGIPIPPALNFE